MEAVGFMLVCNHCHFYFMQRVPYVGSNVRTVSQKGGSHEHQTVECTATTADKLTN